MVSSAHAREQSALPADEIHIAVHRYYPYYVDGVGIAADIFRAAFATQGIRVVLHEYPIMRGINKMMTHQVDGFSPGTLFITRQTEREKLLIVPYMMVNVDWLFAGNNNPLGEHDLQGKILATPTSQDKPQPYYKPFIDRGMRYVTVEQPQRQVRLIISGRADFATMTLLTGIYLLFENGVEDLSGYGFAPVMNPFAINLVLAKDNPRASHMAAAFKRGLQVIMENGVYLDIHENYWGKGNVPKRVLFDALQAYGVDEPNMRLLLRQHQYLNLRQ